MFVNKALGLSYLQFNKNVTVGANNYIVIHPAYSSGAVELGYCPFVATFCPTILRNILLYVGYGGEVRVYNQTSSALSNANVQGMMTWRARDYPK